jgi:hypothetical protein
MQWLLNTGKSKLGYMYAGQIFEVAPGEAKPFDVDVANHLLSHLQDKGLTSISGPEALSTLQLATLPGESPVETFVTPVASDEIYRCPGCDKEYMGERAKSRLKQHLRVCKEILGTGEVNG